MAEFLLTHLNSIPYAHQIHRTYLLQDHSTHTAYLSKATEYIKNPNIYK
ncbi:MAG: hypothetical protein Q4A24_00085 [Akkermansia sp.]|nr:hypothetical protein [Akkermansia sp.]